MKVKQTVETPEGTVQFEGELSQEEVDLIIGVGLNFLLQQGAIPFRVSKASERASFIEGSTEEQ